MSKESDPDFISTRLRAISDPDLIEILMKHPDAPKGVQENLLMRKKAQKKISETADGIKNLLNKAKEMIQNNGWLNYFQEGDKFPEMEEEAVDNEGPIAEQVLAVLAENEDNVDAIVALLLEDEEVLTKLLEEALDEDPQISEPAIEVIKILQPFAKEVQMQRRGGSIYYAWSLKNGGRCKKQQMSSRDRIHNIAKSKTPKASKGCACKKLRVARVGGQLVQVDCNNRIIK